MPHKLFRTTPAEAAAHEIFERDVAIMRHLVNREYESMQASEIPEVAIHIAEMLLDYHLKNDIYDPEKMVLDLYQLDETKQRTLELLQGV